MLIDQIAPHLRSVIPHAVTPFGGEDPEELVQDSIVVAAQLLHSVEAQGKTVTAKNIVYYAILSMKSGRRSQSGSRADAMAPATQLDQKSRLSSTEDEIGYDPELDEPITLGDMLSCDHEDPATLGARNLDWETFIGSHDYRYGIILKGMAEGRNLRESAENCGVGKWAGYHLQRGLAKALGEFMGAEAIADAARAPSWKAEMNGRRRR